jgi:DNA-binding transcriptional MocR family regulator
MGHKYLSGNTAISIAASVEHAVRARVVQAGERLPSVREAAEFLGVNRNTVAAAYARLRDAGIIVGGSGRGGMRIAATQPVEGGAMALPSGICDLASGDIDAAFLPRLDRVLGKLDLTPSGCEAHGDDPALVALMHQKLGAEGLDTRHHCFLSGALVAMERALRWQWQRRAGAAVLVEDPGYPPLFDLLRSLGLKPRPIPLDEEGPEVEALEAGLKAGAIAAILTPRAQNPFGCDISAPRAAALTSVLQAYPDCLVILDDHWGPIAEGGLTLDPCAFKRWMFVRSVAKFLGPEYRLAIALGDPLTVEQIRRQQVLGPRWVSRLLQRFIVALWQEPGMEARLNDAKAAYRERRHALLQELRCAGLTVHGYSGVFVWVEVPSETEIVPAMLGRGWAVQPGRPFRIASGPAVRLSVAKLTVASAQRAGFDLGQCVTGARRFIS